MLIWSLMNSGHNDAFKWDIRENRFSTLHWEWHLSQRIDQCSETRHQPDTKSRLFWSSGGRWWILVTIVNSNQIFEKIDFRPSVEGDILDKESINAPSLGISQIRNQDYSDARVVPDEFWSPRGIWLENQARKGAKHSLRRLSYRENRSLLRA